MNWRRASIAFEGIQLRNAHVRVGSFATELGYSRHVRFPPESDRTAGIAGGPVRAIGGSDAVSART